MTVSACATALHRPPDGPCAGADPATWLEYAARSLTFAAWQPRGPTYDQTGRAPVAVAVRAPPSDALAVLSYPDPARFAGGPDGFERLARRSFVYDDALAIVWLVARDDLDRARRVADTLAALQRPDGAWGFSFAVDGDGFYNAAYVRAGTVAWVAYALSIWQRAAGDRRFASSLGRAVDWLVAQAGPEGLVRAGRGRWVDRETFDPDWPADFAATEHQIDAWFALRAAARADPELAAAVAVPIGRLEAAIDDVLWSDGEGRYLQGWSAGRRDGGSALDAAGTWAALYDLARGRPHRARRALDWIATHHTIEVGGWRGYRPYATEGPPALFVEGAIAEAAALHRLGQRDDARRVFATWTDLACAGGVPLVYSPSWHTDFPLSPAAAPTLWFLLVGRELRGEGAVLWTERAR